MGTSKSFLKKFFYKGTVGTIQGSDPGSDVVITNTNCWIAPDVHIAQSGKNKFRDYGRNWEFTGQSAEYMQVKWAA